MEDDLSVMEKQDNEITEEQKELRYKPVDGLKYYKYLFTNTNV